MATIEDFEKLDIRVGKIIEVNDHPEARKPGYKLKIDFGPEVGIKNSFSQIAIFYSKEELMGKLVLGILNFPVRKIGSFESEVLTLGVPDNEGKVVLLVPDKENAVIGGKLY
jgi:tRNA-binding protein